eukprot:44262-Chlamydomonas_euryale.AAC.3
MQARALKGGRTLTPKGGRAHLFCARQKTSALAPCLRTPPWRAGPHVLTQPAVVLRPQSHRRRRRRRQR